ncbi:hypothetical protein ACJ2CR_19230 [Myxococcus faecalis]|uniref:hypothetical protein n=1 Tax=Myxococcus faecalis TaxID=3115646 RepID=UPI0038D09147
MKSVYLERSDFDATSLGNLLLEMYPFVGDSLGIYQDTLARGLRLSTATQHHNLIALARMLGYRLYGAQAATAAVAPLLPSLKGKHCSQTTHNGDHAHSTSMPFRTREP